jgi:deaminated glutathione amidase
VKTLVAAIQMTSTDNKAENLDQAEALIENAAKFQARLVSLPENFLFLAKPMTTAFSAAEAIDGPSIKRLRDSAKKHRLWLSLGGFPEKIPQHDKIYNTHLLISDEGDICGQYRKIHLFTAKLPDGSVYDEASGVLPGENIVCLKTPFFSLGLSICYDLRFAHLYSALRDQNADVILVPAAFTEETGKAHWEVLLRARAIETQSYIVAAAQAGKHHENRSTHGHAMIVDPWGVIVAQCGKNNGLAIAEIDLDFVKNLRQQMPVWQHRRLISS